MLAAESAAVHGARQGSTVAGVPRFVAVNGRRVAYDTWGDPDGLPVFQLHGTPGGRLFRYPDNDRLAETGALLVTYDRAGYGLSDRDAGRSVVDCVGDVAAIADDLGIERFAVEGGSGGGPHCLAVAARLPDRVIRCRCVVGAAPYGAEELDWFDGMDAENVKEFGWASEGEDRLREELEREAATMVERVQDDPAAILEGFELSDADRAALESPIVQRIVREATPEMFVNGVFGWVDDDLAFLRPWGFDVREIRVPTEVWYGETDVLVPAAHGRWLASTIPGAEVHLQQDEGHLGDPEKILSRLRGFVDASRSVA
jgi:pimeloyl-ACP methyl ester carboxylesterase